MRFSAGQVFVIVTAMLMVQFAVVVHIKYKYERDHYVGRRQRESVKSEILVPVNATRVMHLLSSIFTMSNLGYRIVTDADLPLLLRYRQECGWGEEAVKKNWNDPDRIYCVFESIIDGEKQDVGMGCWYLHQPDDLELASRDNHVVHIGESFIFTSSRSFSGRVVLIASLSIHSSPISRFWNRYQSTPTPRTGLGRAIRSEGGHSGYTCIRHNRIRMQDLPPGRPQCTFAECRMVWPQGLRKIPSEYEHMSLIGSADRTGERSALSPSYT
jgi:hypothetical protein